MIQYINKLQDKQVKVKILQQIINKVNITNLIIHDYRVRTRNAAADLKGKRYRVELSITMRHANIILTSTEYTAHYIKRLFSKEEEPYICDWEPNLHLFLCFTPSKEDLYNIFFKTNKRLFFTILYFTYC